jgi:hypothetical protein
MIEQQHVVEAPDVPEAGDVPVVAGPLSAVISS